MVNSEHKQAFAGMSIYDYSPDEGIIDPNDAPRLAIDWDQMEAGVSIDDLFAQLLADEKIDQLQGLVIGHWAETYYDEDFTRVVEMLVAAAPKLASVKTIFNGDITYDESEISWIQQCDNSPIWDAYPQLLHFGVRGGDNLKLGEINHRQLETLVVETGGLDHSVVVEIANAHLPNLQHLEIWLGSSYYGADATVEHLAPILEAGRFPKLKYLGLKNSEIQDHIAQAVAQSSLLNQLETLDLSMGVLSDEGGEALLAAEGVKNLKKLDLRHSYLTDDVAARFDFPGVEVDLSDRQQGDDDDRYVSVSE